LTVFLSCDRTRADKQMSSAGDGRASVRDYDCHHLVTNYIYKINIMGRITRQIAALCLSLCIAALPGGSVYSVVQMDRSLHTYRQARK